MIGRSWAETASRWPPPLEALVIGTYGWLRSLRALREHSEIVTADIHSAGSGRWSETVQVVMAVLDS